MRMIQRVALVDNGKIDSFIETDLRACGAVPLEIAAENLFSLVTVRRTKSARSKQPPLNVSSLDGAVTILRPKTEVEKKAPNNISIGDLLVSVNSKQCSDSHERRKLLLFSFNTSTAIKLQFWPA